MNVSNFSHATLATAIVVAVAGVIMAMTTKEKAPVSRIGYASSITLVKHLPETQSALKELDSLKKQFSAEFNTKVGEYKAKASVLERDKARLNDLIKNDREAELRTLQLSITKFQQMADSAYKANEQRLMKPLYEKVQKAIQEVAVQQGYTHIINTDSRDVPMMLYGDKNTNADSLIMQNLNKKGAGKPTGLPIK